MQKYRGPQMPSRTTCGPRDACLRPLALPKHDPHKPVQKMYKPRQLSFARIFHLLVFLLQLALLFLQTLKVLGVLLLQILQMFLSVSLRLEARHHVLTRGRHTNEPA